MYSSSVKYYKVTRTLLLYVTLQKISSITLHGVTFKLAAIELEKAAKSVEKLFHPSPTLQTSEQNVFGGRVRKCV
jgi:hypothetical protein